MKPWVGVWCFSVYLSGGWGCRWLCGIITHEQNITCCTIRPSVFSLPYMVPFVQFPRGITIVLHTVLLFWRLTGVKMTLSVADVNRPLHGMTQTMTARTPGNSFQCYPDQSQIMYSKKIIEQKHKILGELSHQLSLRNKSVTLKQKHIRSRKYVLEQFTHSLWLWIKSLTLI